MDKRPVSSSPSISSLFHSNIYQASPARLEICSQKWKNHKSQTSFPENERITTGQSCKEINHTNKTTWQGTTLLWRPAKQPRDDNTLIKTANCKRRPKGFPHRPPLHKHQAINSTSSRSGSCSHKQNAGDEVPLKTLLFLKTLIWSWEEHVNKREGVWSKRTDGSASREVHQTELYHQPFIFLRALLFTFLSLLAHLFISPSEHWKGAPVLPIQIQIDTHTHKRSSAFSAEVWRVLSRIWGDFFFFLSV